MALYITPNRTGEFARHNRFQVLFPTGNNYFVQNVLGFKLPTLSNEIGELWDGTFSQKYVICSKYDSCKITYYAPEKNNPLYKWLTEYIEHTDDVYTPPKSKAQDYSKCSQKKDLILKIINGQGDPTESFTLKSCLVKTADFFGDLNYSREGSIANMMIELEVEKVILPSQSGGFSLSQSGVSFGGISIGPDGVSLSAGDSCSGVDISVGPQGIQASGTIAGISGNLNTVDGINAGMSSGGTMGTAGTRGGGIGR